MTNLGSLDGRVAFITGAGRGQGRAHSVRLAQDGAAILALDICADIEGCSYPNAQPEDLAETARLVEKEGGTIVTKIADVRDYHAVQKAFDEGMAELGGRVDIVVANAGIVNFAETEDFLVAWNDTIDTNLSGVYFTVRAALPTMIEGGRGGSVVITSSTAGIKGTGTDKAGGAAYSAAKRGLVGLMQVWANDLAKHSIRVNTIHPTGVVSGMTQNQAMADLVAAGDPALSSMINALPIEILQPEDIANAVAWLVSDEAHYITGIQFPLDAGFTVR